MMTMISRMRSMFEVLLPNLERGTQSACQFRAPNPGEIRAPNPGAQRAASPAPGPRRRQCSASQLETAEGLGDVGDEREPFVRSRVHEAEPLGVQREAAERVLALPRVHPITDHRV